MNKRHFLEYVMLRLEALSIENKQPKATGHEGLIATARIGGAINELSLLREFVTAEFANLKEVA